MDKNTWQLLAKHFAKELDNEEQKRFEKWRNNSSNQELLTKAEEIWKQRIIEAEMTDEEFLASIDSNAQQVWSGIEQTIQRSPSYSSPIQWVVRIAASVILVIGLGWLWNTFQASTDPTSGMEMAYGTETPQEVQLSDGSMVWLNDGASLAYSESFDGHTRTVHLTGEAYFDITRDESKPFIIQMNESVVQVLGTSFNLAAGDETAPTEVTVTSGKVSLTGNKDPENSIYLTKGEVGLFDPATGQLSEAINENPNFLAWKTGILTFENQRLERVVKTLNAHYKTNIKLNQPTLADSPLTASFDNQSIDEVLAVIAAVHGLQISKSTDGFVIQKSNTKTQD